MYYCFRLVHVLNQRENKLDLKNRFLQCVKTLKFSPENEKKKPYVNNSDWLIVKLRMSPPNDLRSLTINQSESFKRFFYRNFNVAEYYSKRLHFFIFHLFSQ